MKNSFVINIQLIKPTQVSITSETPCAGNIVNESFDLANLNSSTVEIQELGHAIMRILLDWHPKEFAAVPAQTMQVNPFFNDTHILETLYARSVKEKTLVYASAIEELIKIHAEKNENSIYDALAEDWPIMRAVIEKKNSSI